jgi:hypothetical protein
VLSLDFSRDRDCRLDERVRGRRTVSVSVPDHDKHAWRYRF